MVTFQLAAAEYLRTITSTHSPATMRTYQRNFDVILTPYFGADTPLTEVTADRVRAFLTSDELLRKPNGKPRAEPTKDQITGLLRAFLTDAGMTDLPAIPRTRRAIQRLCAKCRAPLEPQPSKVPAIAEAPAEESSAPDEPEPTISPVVQTKPTPRPKAAPRQVRKPVAKKRKRAK